jgi:hypothetical protein
MKSLLRKSPSHGRSRNSAAVMTVIAAMTGPSAAVAQTSLPCAALAGRSIEAKLIGLPSGGASITSAAIEQVRASQWTTVVDTASIKVE